MIAWGCSLRAAAWQASLCSCTAHMACAEAVTQCPCTHAMQLFASSQTTAAAKRCKAAVLLQTQADLSACCRSTVEKHPCGATHVPLSAASTAGQVRTGCRHAEGRMVLHWARGAWSCLPYAMLRPGHCSRSSQALKGSQSHCRQQAPSSHAGI